MPYTIKTLATLAGISVRTLHHYDHVGLLTPSRAKKNGYRYYQEDDLLILQQILFFRELELPLEDIKHILTSPSFDMRAALRDQRVLLEQKKHRLSKLVNTIDKTLKKLNRTIHMDDTELYGSFSKEELEKYTEEARERWGTTDAFKHSQARVKKMGKAGLAKLAKASDELNAHIAEAMKAGLDPKSETVQQLIAKHYDGLRAFYEPSFELYRGLASMYLADERFTAHYEHIAKGLARFMHDGMIAYCDAEEDARS